MSLLFKPHHIPMIRDGTKTATRRLWDPDYNRPSVGSIQMAVTELFTPDEACDCYILIDDVYQQRLGDMTLRDYAKEGDYSPAEFKDIWDDIYGFPGDDLWDHLVVDVVEFQYAGRERRHPQRTLGEATP